MRRRRFLATAAALAAPHVSRSAEASVLRFIPQSDLAVLDPIWTAAYVTRNHAMMVFDTLYGTDSGFRVSPQMVAGDTTSADGLTVGQILPPTVYQRSVTDVLPGYALFWNLRKA